MSIFKSFKKSGKKIFEQSLKNSVFAGLDNVSLDLAFLEFLKDFEIEGANIANEEGMKKSGFHSYAAEEIIKKMITKEQQEKLTKLMSELRKKDSFFVDKVALVKKNELDSNTKTVSRKIFQQVEVKVSDSLNLLALIKLDPGDFPESRKLLIEMWNGLGEEESKRKTKELAQNAFSKALDELEKFVNSIEIKEEIDNSSKNDQTQEKDKNKTEIQEVEKYCKNKYGVIKKELKRYSVKENELDIDIQNELAKLKKGGLSQAETDEVKKKISDNIKLKSVEKELDNLLKGYQENIPLETKRNLLSKIRAFVNNNDSFYQQVYQKSEGEIKALMKKIEADEVLQQTLSANFNLTVKSTVGVYFLTVAIILLKKLPKMR